MVEVGVLQCPTCEKLCVYHMNRFEDRDTRKELASVHLRTHRLEESKLGLHRVTMADRFEQIEIGETTDLSIGEWMTPSEVPAALEEAVDPLPVQPSQR